MDPGLTEITIRFDRPMGPDVSTIPIDGEFPAVTGFGFDSTRTTFTLRVKLMPQGRYGILFRGEGFQSPDGYPLKDFPLRFRTK